MSLLVAVGTPRLAYVADQSPQLPPDKPAPQAAVAPSGLSVPLVGINVAELRMFSRYYSDSVSHRNLGVILGSLSAGLGILGATAAVTATEAGAQKTGKALSIISAVGAGASLAFYVWSLVDDGNAADHLAAAFPESASPTR